MNTYVYDRRSGEVYEEPQFQENALRFLYHTAPGRLLLNLLISRRWFSRLMAWPDTRRRSVRKIAPFAERYGIDLDEYPQKEYASFADFFIRRIDPARRPLDLGPDALIATADAKLRAYPAADGIKLTIKGCDYTLPELLGPWHERFRGGVCLVFRLTMDDYHRLCHIDDGRRLERREVKGRLHTVGPMSDGRCKVYVKNHRIASLWEMKRFGLVAALDVGAMLVGRIVETGGEVFLRGGERGYFACGGSTTLLFFERGRIILDDDIRRCSGEGMEVRVRQREHIGRCDGGGA